jgi:hypothetical protein
MSQSCPVCGKPPQEPHTPFCSARCKQVDLHRWMSEVYRIESSDTPEMQIPNEEDE